MSLVSFGGDFDPVNTGYGHHERSDGSLTPTYERRRCFRGMVDGGW